MQVEDLCRRHEELPSHPSTEDVMVGVILDLSPRRLKEHLALMCREENNQRGHVETVEYTQRHRNQFHHPERRIKDCNSGTQNHLQSSPTPQCQETALIV